LGPATSWSRVYSCSRGVWFHW
jgi:ABC-type transport system, involved in lipoprotein release, permease component